MELLKLAAFCAVCILPAALLRKHTPEQALLLTLAVLLLVLARCLQAALPALEEIKALFARAGTDAAYVSVLLKITAAALVTKVCSDLCRDGGSQALASAVETAGSIASVVIALPLIKAVANLLTGFFS